MKIYSLFGLILISLIFISSCNSQTQVTPVCNKPYLLVGEGCCLDQNDNSICDKDESDNNKSILLDRSVQALTVEECTSNNYFDCPYSYIHKDSIEFNLKVTKAGRLVITKIDLPNVPCQKTFEDNPIFLEYNDVTKFILKCDIKKDAVGSDIIIDLIYYEWDAYGYYKEPQRITAKSWISGIVR